LLNNFSSEKTTALQDKVIGLNAIIDQWKEEITNKTSWGNELLEKYEKTITYNSIYKKTIQALQNEKEQQRQDYESEISYLKKKDEK